MKGWVYVITNKGFLDLVKVGFTTKVPDYRAKDLDNAGQPYPLIVEYEVLVNEAYQVEQKVHKILNEKWESKEWYRCSVEEAIAAIKQIVGEIIIFETNYYAERNKAPDYSWLDELIAWAKENKIPVDCFPRNNKAILSKTKLVLFTDKEIKILSEHIGKLTNLTELTIGIRSLTELPESIGNLVNLKILYIHSSLLTTLPESIGKLTELTELRLPCNKLDSLPESIGNLTNLAKLDISKNKITKLPESIGNLVKVNHFCLVDNQLMSLPESFGNFKITELTLCNNKFSNLPQCIFNLTRLKCLNLRDNELLELSENIEKLVGLKELYLDNNKLTNLPENIGNLRRLTCLALLQKSPK